jgi:hypothetical protein
LAPARQVLLLLDRLALLQLLAQRVQQEQQRHALWVVQLRHQLLVLLLVLQLLLVSECQIQACLLTLLLHLALLLPLDRCKQLSPACR